MKGYKVRIADGSEIGPMDLQAVRNWYAQGLLESDSPVLAPGAKHWVPLAKAIDLVDLRGRRGAPALRPSARSAPWTRASSRTSGRCGSRA